jgi:hypothetical protein
MFGNRSFNVKVVKDEEQPDKPVITLVDFAAESEAIARTVVTAYVLCKSFKTVCSIVEHVVVTKVKVN